jgi:hypothetical protein
LNPPTFVFLRCSHPTKTGKQRIAEGVQRLDQGAQQTKSSVLSKIDEADRKIEQEASKAKGGILSWFGWGK